MDRRAYGECGCVEFGMLLVVGDAKCQCSSE